MQVIARAARKPSLYFGHLVGAVIVRHQVNIEDFRYGSVDLFQKRLEALEVALALVSAEVNHLSRQPNIRLSWLEGRRHDLGLPVPPRDSLLPVEKEATKNAKSKARASNRGKKGRSRQKELGHPAS